MPEAKPASQPEKASQAPTEAPRRGDEQIVYLKLSDLHAFKNHPFQVRNDEEMRAMVSSVKDKGVTQPAIVRPREDGGYEIVSGHRRQKASELAGYADMPCIIRNLTDEQAITQMVEDNTNQRENILPSERAKALKMQLEAIKHQGAKNFTSGQIDPKDAGKRSNEIVAEHNKMTVKQVQCYIKLNDLVPDLQKMMDGGQVKFTPAVELSYIKPKNQQYIAVAIESQQSSPSFSQAQCMRELDQKGGPQRGRDRWDNDGGQEGGRQSDPDRSGIRKIFWEGKHPEGNEGPDHQTSGRLEGPAEGSGEAGEKEGPAGEVGAASGQLGPRTYAGPVRLARKIQNRNGGKKIETTFSVHHCRMVRRTGHGHRDGGPLQPHGIRGGLLPICTNLITLP